MQDRTSAEPPPSACYPKYFEEARFTVCDPGSGELKLFAASPKEQPLRSFADVARRIDAKRVAFAMNAGMFDSDGRPIGLAIVEGQQVHAINLRKGSGNFHLLPNGVFLVRTNGRPEVVRSDAYKLSPDVRLATQSGPMLVINGKLHSKIDPDGESRNVRNGVGVTANGNALFVISDEPVSFGKLARFFRDVLKTPNALYFDGYVSSLWDPANGRQDASEPLGPIMVALKPGTTASAPPRKSNGSRARP
jgi:uncharacterized protein YigE (DUF2233 family)